MTMHVITEQDRETIKSYLRKHARTQEDLAAYMGVSPVTFSRWMNGAITKIRDSNWSMLLNQIGLSDTDDGLTKEEHQVFDALVSAWNCYVELPSQHPDDIDEFRHSLHRLQHLLMARVVRREHPTWTNEE